MKSSKRSKDSKSSKWTNIDEQDIVFTNFPYDGEDFDLKKLPRIDRIAAFFIETYQGWGAWLYPDKYLKDQEEAMIKKKGMWSGEFIFPEEWRKKNK